MLFCVSLAACASNKSALARLHDDGNVKFDASTRLLLAALAECRAADAEGDETWLRIHECNLVIEELRIRRNRRELEVYGSPDRMRELTSSCAAAADAMTIAASMHGPLTLPDGVVLPPFAGLRDAGPRRGFLPPSEGEGAMSEHARALVRCGDGKSLGVLLEMKDGLAQELLREDRRAVMEMVDAEKAPPSLVAMAGRLPERRPCPSSEDEVVALMRGTREDDRIHGCTCTNRLPPGGRAVAERERARLASSDPHSVTTTSSPPPSRSSSPDLANAPPGTGLVVMLPSVLEALLSRGSSATRYPVREACAATARAGDEAAPKP